MRRMSLAVTLTWPSRGKRVVRGRGLRFGGGLGLTLHDLVPGLVDFGGGGAFEG